MMLALASVTLGACGGTTRHETDDGGFAGTGGTGVAGGTGSAGAESTIPKLNGVPIGDCAAPTDATRRAGCPVQEPTSSTACEAGAGLKQCPYDLQVSEGRATQLVYLCHPDQSLWNAIYVECGTVCGSLTGGVIELDASCGDRQPVSCKNTESTFAFETDQQWLDDAFERVLAKCLGETRYNHQFRIELADGCATRLSSDAPFSEEAAACLATELDSVRWQCGLLLSCATFSAPILM